VKLHDLTTPLDLGQRYEIVSCIEVAEHLNPEAAMTLVDSICRHASKWVIWTAAVPGQGGDGHVNCQVPDFWQGLFEYRGLKIHQVNTELLRLVWTNCTGGMWWLRNVWVFEV
jgi:hypothetical protein